MSDTPPPTPALPQTTTMRRLKRSRTLQVTSLMATASFSLAACGAPQPRVPAPEPEPVLAYTSLEECKAANDVTPAECDAAEANARAVSQETAPRYATQSECEGAWGPDQCRPNNQGGGSFFTPLLTGFLIGQALNGGGYRGGGALYRDRDGNFQNGYGGGYLGRDYRTGRQIANGREHGADVARQAPSRVQSRTTVVSRGGFGGGGRGYGG